MVTATAYMPRRQYYVAIVLFNPESDSYTINIGATLRAGLLPIVFDNSGRENGERNQQTLRERFPHQEIAYLSSGKNVGLSAAYNKVLEEAERLGTIEGVIFLDQDSVVPEQSISSLIAIYEQASARGPVGVIAGMAMRDDSIPCRVYVLSNPNRRYDGLVELKMAPSSFSLIPLSAIRRVGKFYDDFFIDHIDRDFCFRCHRAGLLVAMNPKAPFLHKIGEGLVTILGYYVSPVSSPFRHYFQVRNLILSARRKGATWLEAAIEILKRFVMIGIVGLFAGQLFKRYWFALRGLIDGYRNRSGPMA